MQAIKAVSLALLGLAGSCFTLVAESALEFAGGSETNFPSLSATVSHEEGPGILPSDRIYATLGTNKFSLLVPAGYKMEGLSKGGLALVNQDYSCQITFRPVGPLPADGAQLNPDIYSERILADHPGAKILRVFSSIADSRTGPAFEFQCAGTAGSWRRAQTAFIPSWSGVLEFSLVSSPEKFEAARQKLNTVMLTFRASDPKGELHISPLSDKL